MNTIADNRKGRILVQIISALKLALIYFYNDMDAKNDCW